MSINLPPINSPYTTKNPISQVFDQSPLRRYPEPMSAINRHSSHPALTGNSGQSFDNGYRSNNRGPTLAQSMSPVRMPPGQMPGSYTNPGMPWGGTMMMPQMRPPVMMAPQPIIVPPIVVQNPMLQNPMLQYPSMMNRPRLQHQGSLGSSPLLKPQSFSEIPSPGFNTGPKSPQRKEPQNLYNAYRPSIQDHLDLPGTDRNPRVGQATQKQRMPHPRVKTTLEDEIDENEEGDEDRTPAIKLKKVNKPKYSPPPEEEEEDEEEVPEPPPVKQKRKNVNKPVFVAPAQREDDDDDDEPPVRSNRQPSVIWGAPFQRGPLKAEEEPRRNVKPPSPVHRSLSSIGSEQESPKPKLRSPEPADHGHPKKNLSNRLTDVLNKKEDDWIEKQNRKKKAKHRITVSLWTMLYPVFLLDQIETRAVKKIQSAGKKVVNTLADVHDELEEYIKKAAEKELLALHLNSPNLKFIFTDKNTKSEKVIAREILSFWELLKPVMIRLIKGVATLPDSFFRTWGDMVSKGATLPHEYFTKYELKRLPIGSFGSIRDIDRQTIKLIVCSILVVRGFIYFFILYPSEILHIKQSDFNVERMINVASILYQITMEHFDQKRVDPKAQEKNLELNEALTIKPAIEALRSVEDPKTRNSFKFMKDNNRKEEIIEDLYSKSQLHPFFIANANIAKEVKQHLNAWIDAITDRIMEASNK